MNANDIDDKTGLIIIDVQKGWDDPRWGSRNNPDAEKNIGKLLEHWRSTNRPVIHIQHMSTYPNSPLMPNQEGNEIKDEVKPLEDGSEPIFQKTVNSGFIGTDLEQYLHNHEIKSIVITGITTNYCVSSTARMAGNLGFKTFVVDDASACFDTKGPDGTNYTADQIHAISIANLHQEFAKIVITNDLI